MNVLLNKKSQTFSKRNASLCQTCRLQNKRHVTAPQRPFITPRNLLLRNPQGNRQKCRVSSTTRKRWAYSNAHLAAFHYLQVVNLLTWEICSRTEIADKRDSSLMMPSILAHNTIESSSQPGQRVEYIFEEKRQLNQTLYDQRVELHWPDPVNAYYEISVIGWPYHSDKGGEIPYVRSKVFHLHGLPSDNRSNLICLVKRVLHEC